MAPAITLPQAVGLAIQVDNHRDYTGDFDLCLYVRGGRVHGVVSDPVAQVEVIREETLTPDEGGMVTSERVVVKKNPPKRVKE